MKLEFGNLEQIEALKKERLELEKKERECKKCEGEGVVVKECFYCDGTGEAEETCGDCDGEGEIEPKRD